MGNKKKVGKARKDVFYHRAKEAGYRARAAYKLIQLNKKFNFLSTSRVCIDLCAAPGSWMQVCSKFMPVSSVIIGVDRYPISYIPNTISLQGDITTEKVRHDLRTNLKTWKADLVLHDGAPNVGQNWLHDAYQQNLLVLHSFKLACEFLQKGGTFVTKIFRSKDHLSLEYVFRKLFKKVETTKPIASRFVSAEIFIVCIGYLAPDKVDPKFFDPKAVFQGLESEPRNAINLLKPEKKKKAEGYEEGATMLFKISNISEFIKSTEFIDILEQANKFEWDDEFAKESHRTTEQIVEFCKDIKVLGKNDLKTLLKWRKNIRKDIEELVQKRKETEEAEKEVPTPEEEEKDEFDEEIEAMGKIQKEVLELKTAEAREEKKKKKRAEKKRKRLQEKLNLKLMVPGDLGPGETNAGGLFNINVLDKSNLDDVVNREVDDILQSSDESEDDGPISKKSHYMKGDNQLDRTGQYHKTMEDSDTEEEHSESESSDEEGLGFGDDETKEKTRRVTFNIQEESVDDDSGKHNPLTTDLVGDVPQSRRERKAEKFFSKTGFDDVEDEELEDYELEAAINIHKKKGDAFKLKEKPAKKSEGGSESGYDSTKEVDMEDFSAKDCPDSDDEVSDNYSDSESEEETAKEPPKKKKRGPQLTPVGLALATKMIHSKKVKRDMMDNAWNRYMHGEEDLPDFFAADEKRHNKPQILVDPSDLRYYQERNKDVDVKTIKKAVEAKARKLRRAKKIVSRSRKKVENITNNMDMTSREKAVELKKIYKNAAKVMKPKDKKYVVMKRSMGGRKPKGQKGQVKLVDKRLKKDKRATVVNLKRENKRKS